MDAALSQFLTDVAGVFAQIIGLVTDVLTKFTTEPILLFLAGLMFTGAVFSFALRLIYRR